MLVSTAVVEISEEIGKCGLYVSLTMQNNVATRSIKSACNAGRLTAHYEFRPAINLKTPRSPAVF